MLVVAFVCWLAVTIFSASAVMRLLSPVVSPRALDIALLPGTLLARFGQIAGLLLTGGSTSGVKLIGGGPAHADADEGTGRQRFLPATMATLLPLAACTFAIVLLVKELGVMVARAVFTASASKNMPAGIESFWALLRHTIDLMESTLAAAARCNLGDWRVWAFFYLLVCFALRMSPSRGNLRGSLAALAVIGLVLALVGLMYSPLTATLNRGWPVISLVAATNLLALLVALMARGGLHVVRALRGR